MSFLKKKPKHDLFFWMLGLLILLGSIAIIASTPTRHPGAQPRGGSTPKSMPFLLVQRTDGFTDHNPNTAMHFNREDQTSFKFTFTGASTTDVRLHSISFSTLSSTLEMSQIAAFKLWDGPTLIAVLDSPLCSTSSSTVMGLDYIIPSGSTKELRLTLDIRHGVQIRTFKASMFNVQASDVSTGLPVDTYRIPGFQLVSWNFPLSSAFVDVVYP